MTGTDEFGHELDAQGYERVAGPADGVRPDARAAAPLPRGPQPVGQPGQVPPWTAGAAPVPGGGGPGYAAEPAYGAPQRPPVAAGMPGASATDVTARQSMPPVPGHDAPTAEFARIYDGGEPDDYEVPPAAAPPSAPRFPTQQGPLQQQVDVQQGPIPQQMAGQPGPIPQQMAPMPQQMGAVPPVAAPGPQAGPHYPPPLQPQQGQQPPQAQQIQQLPQVQQGPDEVGYPEQDFDPLAGSASWSAAPPRAGGPIPQARPAQAQRPAVPAQPMPTPDPLPERGAARSGVRPAGGAAASGAVAAGRPAVRQQAAVQTESDPLASSGQRRAAAAQQAKMPQAAAPNVYQDTQIGAANAQQQGSQFGAPNVHPDQQAAPSIWQQSTQGTQIGAPNVHQGQQAGVLNGQQGQPVGPPNTQQHQGPQIGAPNGLPGEQAGAVNGHQGQQAGAASMPQGQQPAPSNLHQSQQTGIPNVRQAPQPGSSVFDSGNTVGFGASAPFPELRAQSGSQQAQPPQPVAPQVPQAQVQVQQQPQAAASPETGGVRETMAPPRRRVPSAQPPATDDLSSERLRSVAPTVPAPRRMPDDSAQDLPSLPPPATQPAPAQTPPPQQPAQFNEGGQDADELVVPWQSVAQPVAEGLEAGQTAPRGTRRRTDASVDDALPEPVGAPQPVLLDPEPGDEDDFQPPKTAGAYESEFQPEDADDPLSGSGAHARPPAEQQPVQQLTQTQPQQPVAAQQQAAKAPAVGPQLPQQPVDQPQPAPQPQPVQQVQPQQVPASAQAQQQPQNRQPEPDEPQAPAQVQPQPQAQAQPAKPPTTAAVQPPSAPVTPATPTAAPATGRRTTAKQSAKATSSSAAAPRTARARTQQPAETQPASAAPTASTASAQAAAATTSAAPVPAATKAPAKVATPTKVPAPVDVSDPADDSRAPGYDEEALEAVYRVIHERRDIRNDFLPDELPTGVLTRILEAAHTAPSVGFSQPWDFLVLRDEERRRAVHDLAARQRRAYAASLPKARAKAFAALKIEAILETPVNIVVTCDPTRGGRHTLGRYTQPMMAPFSTCLAVENLWLAARAEGLGVGWVSFFDERELAETLGLPEHLQIVAYLCVGYVKRFPAEPELAGAGWAKRRPLSWAVHEEDYGRRAMPGGSPVSLLDATVDAVRGLDETAVAAARERQGRMTKPPGSLGMLEHVAEQLAGLSGECPPPLPEPAALAVFAADHGVHAQGVTPWPQEVTAQMVSNFLSGGAVVNAFAKQVGAEVCVVDVGVNANLGNAAGLVPRKVRFGTADMTQGPAMSRDEAMAAIEAGIETARDLVAAGNRCLLTGDMGIANTTASAALIAAFTGASPAQVTGYGTGIDEQTYAHKVEIVRRALELHRPDPQDPIGVLSAFGGLEHAALAGFILGGSALRIPVVLDGVIAGAAALVAQAIAPEVTAACVAGHRSAEPGHALALEALGVNPLIDLELRLGEGSGAVLALPLVAAAVRALREVATFDSAGVADASSAAVAPAERGREA
jgi:nicotinate-nucleotide--dimethylbenzimidazole phosphoribosyltransferase